MASFDAYSVDSEDASSFRRFDEGYMNFDSYSNFSSHGDDSAPPPQYQAGGDGFSVGEEVTVDHLSHSVNSPDPYSFGSDPNAHYSQQSSPFDTSSIPVENGSGKPYDISEDADGIFSSAGPVLPTPGEVEPEEGFALREWHRQNAIRLEEKEKKEKEMQNQIVEEAEEYKKAFHEKRKLNIETNKTNNREKEKLHLASCQKFHKEADKHYWKSIAELIPNEVPNIEKKRGKKDQEKKPSITVIQGPKPGKPTDLSRMRQMLVKLKHNPPPHMLPPPPAPAKDAKAGKDNKNVNDGKAVKVGKDGAPNAAGAAVEVATAPAKDASNGSHTSEKKPSADSGNQSSA